MKTLFLTTIISLLLALNGHTQNKETEQIFRDKQDSVFRNLFNDIDLAKKEIDRLFEQADEMTDTTAALNYNLLGIYLNITGNLDSSITVFKKGLEINGDNKYRKPKFLSNIGSAHKSNGQYNQSIAIFEDLKQFYLEENDSLGYAKMLGELGGIYNLTLQHEKAVKHLTQAIKIYEKFDGNQSELASIMQRLANSYVKQEKLDFALEIYSKTLEKFKATNRLDNYFLTLINVADCYQYKNQYEKALETINESIEGLLQYKNSRLLAVAYGVKGDALKNLKQYKKSKVAYEEAISHAYETSSNRTVQIAREFMELLITQNDQVRINRLIKETQPFYEDANIEYQYSYLETIANAYANSRDYKKAFKVSKNAHELKDSSYYQNKEELVDDIQALYRVAEREKENKELNKTIVKKDENLSMLTIGTIILIILILFILVTWITRANYQKRILSLEKERADEFSSKLNIETENLQLKERLIEQQNTELLGYSMEVANMNEKIDNLIQSTDEIGENNSIGKQLKSLIKADKSYDSFIVRFKELEPNFIPRISKAYPQLTQKDLEFCSLVRINISYKDIANFLQISHDSVFKKRYRIAQKMDLEKGTEFQQFIIQF
jgi:tetratricopeptide (TPR) repeat protein